MAQYLPLVLIAALAIAFAAGQLFITKLFGPKNMNAAKAAPYECGIIPSKQPPERFPVRFYLVAMIFIVFDVEVIFLYPYVVNADRLGVFGLVEMIVFSTAVLTCLIYLIANGALDWGPAKQLGVRGNPARTTASTVRRVGLEGRLPDEVPANGAEVAA